jgi:WD40 repeat protein
VEIWDRRTEKVLTKLVDPKISKNGIKQAHSDEIFDIEFDDSGKRLMTLSGNTLKIWYINSCDEQTLRQSLKIDPLGLAPQFPLPRTGEKRKNFNRKDQPKQVSKNY